MRRKDRELPRDEAERILRENQFGILSLLCAGGTPYGVPLNYAYSGGKLYFHHTSAEESLLNGCIPGPTPACFTVVGPTELLPARFSTNYESAIAFGTVRETDDKLAALLLLVEALSPAYTEQGRRYAEAALEKVRVYEFEIRQLTGKARRPD